MFVQYLGNMLISHTCFSETQRYKSYSTLKCAFRFGMSVFVLVCVNSPTGKFTQ